MSAKKKADFGALAARQISRDQSSAAKAPDRFQRAEAALTGPRSLLELDEILPRQQATRDLDEGHVRALRESIGALGLIEPIVVDAQHRLLAGGHRCEAIRMLRAEQPEAFARWFSEGVQVRVMDFDADSQPARALEVEVAENEHRRDYTTAQVRDLVTRLKDAGYRDTVGRPRAGEKALGPALEVIVGKSMKTIRKLLSEDDDVKGQGRGGTDETPISKVLRVLAKQRPLIPASLLSQFDGLVSGLEAELQAELGQ